MLPVPWCIHQQRLIMAYLIFINTQSPVYCAYGQNEAKTR